ncbi:MAG: hypothetical protein QMD71_08860 [bacterium]|nr:hypothetical protein [bacterium]
MKLFIPREFIGGLIDTGCFCYFFTVDTLKKIFKTSQISKNLRLMDIFRNPYDSRYIFMVFKKYES